MIIKKGDRFKISAYENAADSIARSAIEARDLWEQGKLTDLPGIGKSIGGHLNELFKTGKSAHFDSIFRNLPQGMFPLLEINGVGPKTAYKLAKVLKLNNRDSAVSRLEKAVKENKIAGIEGFGQESQDNISAGISEWKRREDRMLLPEAVELAENIRQFLEQSAAAERVETLGSLRRRTATVGDIDLAVATNEPKKVIGRFLEYKGWNKILSQGENTARARHRNGRQIDLKTEPPGQFGSLLQHYTGSKMHNVKLREYALTRGYSLSEHGIKKLNKAEGNLIKFPEEKEFYEFLGMEWIPPELREGEDEIEAGLEKRLPKLVKLEDIKGDLHIHSNFDIETSHDLGASSLGELVKKAEKLGYEYIAITDHNSSVSLHSDKQIVDLIKRRNEDIDQFIDSRGKNMKIRIIKSLEVDIMPDGRRAIPDEAMDLLDLAIVSIHSNFREGREKQTARVLNALNHPKVKIFGHPTGRKLLQREGVEYDWNKIFEFCRKNGVWLEINANPQRLDLPDKLVREAIKAGVFLSLGTDSHEAANMEFMPLAVDVARRGWSENKNIINTRPFYQLLTDT